MTTILDPTAVNLPDDEDRFGDGPGYCPVCGAKGYSCREKAMLGSGGGVTIVRRVRTTEGEAPPMHTLTAKTWVNKDSTKVVPEGSADAAYLLGLAGDEISDETATRLGLGAYEEAAPSKSVADLKAELDAAGVEYPSKAKKAELEAILEANVGEGAGTADEETGGVAQAENPAEA